MPRPLLRARPGVACRPALVRAARTACVGAPPRRVQAHEALGKVRLAGDSGGGGGGTTLELDDEFETLRQQLWKQRAAEGAAGEEGCGAMFEGVMRRITLCAFLVQLFQQIQVLSAIQSEGERARVRETETEGRRRNTRFKASAKPSATERG